MKLLRFCGTEKKSAKRLAATRPRRNKKERRSILRQPFEAEGLDILKIWIQCHQSKAVHKSFIGLLRVCQGYKAIEFDYGNRTRSFLILLTD